MSKLFSPQIVTIVALLLIVVFVGCSHTKTKRGHLFRADWAFEYNRTPWVGMPDDADDCEEDEGRRSGIRGLFSCLKRDGNDRKQQRFRHHCAMHAECSAEDPCCRTLGCGMWIDPNEPAMQVALGGAARACGLLPFCQPQRPCSLTPHCGRPANINVSPQALMMAHQQAVPGGTPSAVPTVRGMSPTGVMPTGTMPGGMMPAGAMPGGTVGTIPGGTLVSRGIVPGASAITSGGMVAAIGVATPAGMMTPVGVRMPNGMVSNAVVLRACVMTPHCTAARPCGLTPHCGGAVAVNMVANNATVLASALQAQGVAGGVMQAGGMQAGGMGMRGMGMPVNPITNQPMPGLMMAGHTQMMHPQAGWAAMPGMMDTGEETAVHHEEQVAPLPETRSTMPVPRFHPVPTQPAFQRSEGMAPTQRTITQTSATTGQRGISERAISERALSEGELEAALDQAYLEGVAAAMDEVERKLEEKRQAVARARLEERILQQSENLQQQLNAQEELRILAMQRERQLQQQALHQQQTQRQQQALQQAEMLAMAEAEPKPTRLPLPRQASPQALPNSNAQHISPTQLSSAQPSPAQLSPAQLAANVRTSVVSGVNEIFAPLLGANQAGTNQRGQAPAALQPRQNTAQPRAELAAAQPDIPVRPPVSPIAPRYGLLPDDEAESRIVQARFADDGVAIRP